MRDVGLVMWDAGEGADARDAKHCTAELRFYEISLARA
jgi:hypothetical protein